MRVLNEGEEAENRPESLKKWKDEEKQKAEKVKAKTPSKPKKGKKPGARTGTKAKPTPNPTKKPYILTEHEINELERLNNRAKDKAAIVQAQEAEVRKRLNLDENAPIPRSWINGGYKFDRDAMKRFCEEFARSSLWSVAAEVAGVDQATVRSYLKTNPLFQEMVEDAKAIYRDKIVRAVHERAVEGIQEPLLGGRERNQVVGYKRVYSDRLLELEAKRVEHSYRDKGGIEINTGGGVMVVNAGNMQESEWTQKYGQLAQAPEEPTT